MPRVSARTFRATFAIVLVPLALQIVPGHTPTAHAATAKPLLTGLLDRTGPPPSSLEDVVKSYVVNVNWSSLQPSAGGALSTATLDNALAQARNRGARVKLRVMAGIHAPDWAKRRGGSPVKLRDPGGSSGTVPRFWTSAFGSSYKDLQRKLAARYDDNKTLAEIVVSRCTTFYAEPFVRQTSVKSNRKALLKAGYTKSKDKACHKQEVKAHRVWSKTRTGLAMNPAQFVKAGGGRTVDDKFTVAMMRQCRKQLHSRCVLENNSIRSPIRSLDPDRRHPHYRRMYRAMTRHSTARAFQTATAERLGKCAKTLDWAADRGAAYVELPWNPADAGCTSKVLRSAARRLG
jgi:hypothetical protein